MENKNNFLKTASLSVLWGVISISLCAAPCLRADVVVPSGEIMDIHSKVEGILNVFGTANLHPGAYVVGGIYAYPGAKENEQGSTVNVYGCAPYNSLWVLEAANTQWEGLPPVVTIYGSRFQIGTGASFAPPKDQLIPGTLNVLDESEKVLFSLWISSDIVIHLKDPGDVDVQDEEEPLKAELLISPKVIRRQSRIPKVLALLRLPEGVTKGDVDGDKPLVLSTADCEVAIEASCQKIIQWRRRRQRVLHVSILAFFDKAKLMEDFTDDGEVELQVRGQLKTGQQFYGSDTIRIIGCRQKPWWHIKGTRRHKNR